MNQSHPPVTFKIACECGASFHPNNLMTHQTSRGHHQRIMRMTRISIKGGKQLMKCQCGYFICYNQAAAHLTGNKHSRMISIRNKGGLKCEQCNLYYVNSFQLHKTHEDHVINKQRKAIYKDQKKIIKEKIHKHKTKAYQKFAQESIQTMEKLTKKIFPKTKKEKIQPLSQDYVQERVQIDEIEPEIKIKKQ